MNPRNLMKANRFQSTLPMRGATKMTTSVMAPYNISIHAPHAGSDDGKILKAGSLKDFNPRSPCGERPVMPITKP